MVGRPAVVVGEGQRHHVAPALGELLRVLALELGARHGPHGRRPAPRRPTRGGGIPRAVGRLAALLPAEGKHGRAHVTRVELELVIVPVADLVGHPHSHRLAARAPWRQIRALGDDHVATVPAPAVEVTPGRGAVLGRRDHLEKAVADGEERVLQSVLPHSGIAMAHLEAKHLAEGLDGGRQLTSHQADLAHAQVHGTSGHAVLRGERDRALRDPLTRRAARCG